MRFIDEFFIAVKSKKDMKYQASPPDAGRHRDDLTNSHPGIKKPPLTGGSRLVPGQNIYRVFRLTRKLPKVPMSYL
jgi:hypothetical protein